MIRNEYRRAFIMLRAVMPGYGGHVRLERRTLTGSMYFIITAPQGVGELAAALVGRQNGEYYAAAIGPLSRDRRGQLALAWQFDPRSIEGRPLEAYAWVAVVATGGPCALALAGNVEGSRAVDARALERVACGLFDSAGDGPADGGTPAADLPEPGSDAAPVDGTCDGVSPGATDGDGGETRGDVRVYTLTRARLRRMAGHGDRAGAPRPDTAQGESEALPAQPVPEEAAAGAAPVSETGQGGADALPAGPDPDEAATAAAPVSEMGQGGAEAPSGQGDPATAASGDEAGSQDAPASVTAAKRLGLDITVPWPGAVESLRRLFATQAPAAHAPDDGFTYVRAAMPAASGYGQSLAGLRVDGGRIVAVRYALAGRRAPEPPAGMEGYAWVPGEGENGFWVTEAAVE